MDMIIITLITMTLWHPWTWYLSHNIDTLFHTM